VGTAFAKCCFSFFLACVRKCGSPEDSPCTGLGQPCETELVASSSGHTLIPPRRDAVLGNWFGSGRGDAGSYLDDNELSVNEDISKMVVLVDRSGKRSCEGIVNSIEVEYRTTDGQLRTPTRHGTTSYKYVRNADVFKLRAGEYITSVTVGLGDDVKLPVSVGQGQEEVTRSLVTYLKVGTDDGRTKEWGRILAQLPDPEEEAGMKVVGLKGYTVTLTLMPYSFTGRKLHRKKFAKKVPNSSSARCYVAIVMSDYTFLMQMTRPPTA